MIEHIMNNTEKIAELRHSLARYGLPPERPPISLGHPQADSQNAGATAASLALFQYKTGHRGNQVHHHQDQVIDQNHLQAAAVEFLPLLGIGDPLPGQLGTTQSSVFSVRLSEGQLASSLPAQLV